MMYSKGHILKLSWPIFIEIFLQLMIGNVDQIMLSSYSQEAVAAVANANQLINVIIFFLSVLSTATTILLAQHLGNNCKEKTAEVCSVSIFFNGIFSAVIGLGLLFGHPYMFNWLEVPNELLSDAGNYISLGALGIVVQGMYLALVAGFRGFSWTKTTMLVALGVNILHIGTNSVLIFGMGSIPSLGVMGVAISTVFCKFVGFLVLFYIFKNYVQVPVSWRYLAPFPWKTLKQLLYVGIPSGGENLSYQLSQTAIMKMINMYGLLVITTKVYVSILAVLSYVYSVALSSAAQVVIGYLIGAGKKDIVKSRGWYAVIISVCVCGIISGMIYTQAEILLGLFTQNREVIELGKQILLIDIFLEICRGVNIALVCCLQATGDIRMPTLTGIICMWIFAVGGAYVFGLHWGLGLIGIWIGMFLDEAIRAVIFIVRWQSESWKKYSLI